MAEWAFETVENCLKRTALGGVPKLQTKDYRPTGQFPIIDQGQSFIAGWTDNASGLISNDLPVVVFGDHTRALKFIDFPFVRGADGTQILRPREGINALFFYYACQAIELPARGYNRHFSVLKEKLVPIPPTKDQAQIANALWQVDLSRQAQVKLLTNMDKLKRAAMRELFGCGLRDEAQKDSEIGPVPASWAVVEFAEVRQWLQYGTSVRCTLEPGTFPVLRIPNIEPGRVNASDLKYCNMEPREAENFLLEAGDLIFIRTNGVLDRLGSCAVYVDTPERALFASYLIRARLQTDKIFPRFAAYFFASERGTGLVAGRATPAADGKYNLNTGTIDSLPLPLPPTLGEQYEIVAILEAIDTKIDLLRAKLTVLDDLFKVLLRGLMSGEIPASELDHAVLAQTPVEGAAA